jgi:hypothetical protein
MLWTYLGLTILFELPIFLAFWYKQGWWQALLFCILLNGLTNPLINLALIRWDGNVYLLELAVFVVEAVAAWAIFKPTWTKALLFSFAANAFSYGLGVVLQWMGWL